ncbi:MAG TPA: hypothetical protein VMG41_02225 [Gemmatimonadales bacterium]|nr:hypothetical protein [Gemmatimonadales bacterium]
MTRPARLHWMLALLLWSVAACNRGGTGDPVPGDATLLAGRWFLVVHRDGQPDLSAVLTLGPSQPNDPGVPRALRGGTLEGSFRFQSQSWLSSPPVDSESSAFIGADGAVILYLRLQGHCVNCGNLGFAGHLNAGEVTGHWTEELNSDAPNGTFTLRRAGT